MVSNNFLLRDIILREENWKFISDKIISNINPTFGERNYDIVALWRRWALREALRNDFKKSLHALVTVIYF